MQNHDILHESDRQRISRNFQICGFLTKAESLGLTMEQALAGGRHIWNDKDDSGKIASSTLKYLSLPRPADVTIQQAFEEIKGLNGFRIQAMCLGLTREQTDGHYWSSNFSNDYSRPGECTLEYLRNCPITIPIEQAMANIRDSRGDKPKRILESTKRGRIELHLTREQLYAGEFGPEQFDAAVRNARGQNHNNIDVQDNIPQNVRAMHNLLREIHGSHTERLLSGTNLSIGCVIS